MPHPHDAKRIRPNIPGYGLERSDGSKMLSWTWVDEQMAQARSYWICSTRPDGNPHAMPIWAVWQDDVLFFSTGTTSVKGKNIAHNPNIVIHLESGDDTLVMEGQAEPVDDVPLIQSLFTPYAKKYGYNPGDDFDPEKPGGWYRFKARRVLAWLEKDYPSTATKWEFE